jgi:hypothetical protein
MISIRCSMFGELEIAKGHFKKRDLMDIKQKNITILASVAALVIFFAAFMPWGSFQAVPFANVNLSNSFAGASDPFPGVTSFNGGPGGFSGPTSFSGMNINFIVTGWSGSIDVGGISLPNWLVVLLAAAVAGISWAIVTGSWQPPRFLSPILVLLGLLQIIATLIILMSSGKSSMGIGLLVTLAGFLTLAYTSIALARTSVPAQPVYGFPMQPEAPAKTEK